MGTGFILDTNTIIYYLEGVLKPAGKDLVQNAITEGARISIISKIELLAWNPPAGSNVNSINAFLRNSYIDALDETVADRTVLLKRTYKKIKLPDAIIAATALCFNFNLISRNTSDFRFIEGLTTIDPFTV
jgi:predicted nucleic acid-binding protein